MAAIIPALVPRALVPSAMAWFASANQTGQIVGPVLGGVLYVLGPDDGLWHRHRALVPSAASLHRADARWSARRAQRADQPALAARRLPLRARTTA